MRWVVDVNSIDGSKATQNYCVEAESWQGALQATRRLRGDESRMAGFSIDITNDGCRAVDPSKKLRYEVTRTTDATPLTPGADAAPPSRRRSSGNPPRPSTKPTPQPPAVVVAPVVAPTPVVAAPAPAPAPKPASIPPPPAPVATVASVPPPAPEIVVPPIVIKREQEATVDVPLTYREYGFALPPGTTEDVAASSLREMLGHIQSAIATSPPGKLVNLAAFDQVFSGRPPVLPLATLTWKDWKPEPSIAFPRRARAVAPRVDGSSARPAPVQAAASVPAPAVVVAPVVVAPVVAAAPVPALRAVEAPVFPAPTSSPPVSQTRPAVQAHPPPIVKRRVRGDELISVLFESMHDLHFLRDSIEGGDFCLALALEKLPSRIGVVYLYDIDRREFVIIAASGATPPGIVGRRFAETEGLLSAAMRKRRAIVLGANDPGIGEHAAALGGAKDMLLAPVMQAGRFLGAIEIADPTDDVPFSELDANAITYMAEQYAEFVAARGVLLDRERSSQPPAMHTR
jgi:GAF domain